jgi:hypothetical protein
VPPQEVWSASAAWAHRQGQSLDHSRQLQPREALAQLETPKVWSSQGWSYELGAEAGPFDVTLVADDIQAGVSRRDKFDLSVSAAGVAVYGAILSPLSLWPPTRNQVTAAVGALVGLATLLVDGRQAFWAKSPVDSQLGLRESW